ERSKGIVKKPNDHHLRQWYALGDLYERAGDIPRARELFRRVATHDPEAFDAAERLRSLH
ncbi:MAG TPA: tetratricopeptide repeat protein, partial [Acidimicrobiales bacterium]|nr:tetratricopeptide repeat protein [Acidimicrobiales bacterium]